MATGGVMGVTNVSNTVMNVSSSLVSEVGKIGLWLQALGLVVILWVIFQIIALVMNRKRMREVYRIKEDMKRRESKIDNILASKKR
jgi:beta-lactamase regulating signal transducer with metallopeptidase domain